MGLLMVLAIVLLLQFSRLNEASKWVLHTDNVVDQARQIQTDLLDMETGMRGYLIGGRDKFLEPYESAKLKLIPAITQLAEMTSTKPEQTARVNQLRIEVEKWVRTADEKISLRRKAGSKWNVTATEGDSEKKIMDEIRLQIEEFILKEDAIQFERNGDFESNQQQLIVFIVGLSLILGLALAYFSRRQLGSLSKAYEKALRVEEEISVKLRAAQEKSEKSSQDIVEILDGMQDGFLETDAHWKIVRVNRVHEKVFSHDRDAILSRNLWDVFPAAAVQSTLFWINTQRAMTTREITKFQEYYPLFDTWVEHTVYPRQGSGVAIFFRDITESKKNREALEKSEFRANRLLNFNILGVVYENYEGTILQTNDAFCMMVGYSRAELLAEPGMKRKITAGKDRLQEEQILQELKTNGSSRIFEKDYIRKDGSSIPVLSARAVVDDTIGEVVSFIIDNSRSKNAEARLDAQIVALESERAIREIFVSTLSHDLRNPLGVVQMSADVLLDDFSGSVADRTKLIQMIFRAALRANRMIENLLDANRMKAGEKLSLRIQSQDLRHVAEEMIDDLKLVYQNHIELESVYSAVRGYWSADAIRRMLENLCTNAIKYGSPNTPVTVKLRMPVGHVEFSVHNEGNPLSPEEQTKLFEPFQRSKSAQASGQQGWGLGLTLVQGLAEAHGGHIRVESSAQAGTTFIVCLPQDARENLVQNRPLI